MPELANSQRSKGHEASLRLRQSRAFIKKQLSEGLPFYAVLAVEEARGMKVKALLMALPGVGSRTAESLMAKAGIPPNNTLKACGHRQLERLMNNLKQMK